MLKLCLILALIPILCLCQGCIPVAASAIAYQSALSAQNHSAYTDYLFATRAKNAERKRAGEAEEPILSKDKWLAEIETPRREYAEYFDAYQHKNSPTNSLIPLNNGQKRIIKNLEALKWQNCRSEPRSSIPKLANSAERKFDLCINRTLRASTRRTPRTRGRGFWTIGKRLKGAESVLRVTFECHP